MKTLLTILALAMPIASQCHGTLPGGVTNLTSTNWSAFDSITAGPAPWCSPSAPVPIATGGTLSYALSQLPDYQNGPAYFDVWIAIGTFVWTTGYPVGTGTGNVFPNVIAHYGVLPLGSGGPYTGCAGMFVAVVPAAPSLAGIAIYSQAFIRDPLTNMFAGSNITCFNL